MALTVDPSASVPEVRHADKSRLSLDLGKMTEGERDLQGGDFLTTARAQNEVAITVRGDNKMKARRIMELLPTAIGKDKVKAAWRPNSSQLAVASEKVRAVHS